MNNKTLGRCCACEKEGDDVRNAIMLNKRSPTPGKGWGCFQCHLPMDGALAVLCDHCLETNAEIKFAVAGYPYKNKRVPIESLVGEFDHRMEFHQDG